MAERADVPGVCAIVDTDLVNDQVEPFIVTANVFVDENLILDPPLSDAILTQIETYLAAHFLTLFEPRVKQEAADGARFTYECDTALGLSSSKFGQMAMVLDPSGTLTQLNKQDRVKWQVQVGNETDVENL